MASLLPVPNDTAGSAPAWWRSWPAAAALAAAVVLAYWNGLQGPFLFDDTTAILSNPTIRRLDSTAVWSPPADGSTTTGRPVVNVSFALNYALSGERVWSYHALNAAIHALAALALMGILRRTLAGPVLRARFGSAAAPLALLAALLWALHPLQTESVASVAQRTESLCGLFYLLTLYGFIRGTEPGTTPRRWFALSVASAGAAMATKEVAVTIPVLVLLYDRTFVAGGFADAWRRHRAWHLALACTWLVLAALICHTGGTRGEAAGFGLGVSTWTYLLKQCEALPLYLGLSIWPHPLVFDYGTAVVGSAADVWGQGAVLVALFAGTSWALFRRPVLGFAGAWFFVILAPSSSVVPLVAQTMAEHRMYLPLAAISVPAVVLAYRLAGSRALPLAAAAAIAFGLATSDRNRDYRDPAVLWTDTIAKCPQNPRAHCNLADVLQERGEADRANEHYARAVSLEPDYVSAHYNWGIALFAQGRTPQAVEQFETALRLSPEHADAHVNLGNCLVRMKRAAEAIPHYEEALRLKPAADVHYSLGAALSELGRLSDAAQHLRTALQLSPGLPEAHYQLARLAEKSGQASEAERHYEDTLRFAPQHALAHAKLGLLLARMNRLDAAAEQLNAAVRLAPDDPEVRNNLGNVLLTQGRAREAIVQYETALRLRPDDLRAIENLRLARESAR